MEFETRQPNKYNRLSQYLLANNLRCHTDKKKKGCEKIFSKCIFKYLLCLKDLETRFYLPIRCASVSVSKNSRDTALTFTFII